MTTEVLDSKVQERDQCYASLTRLHLCLAILFNDDYTKLLIQGDTIIQDLIRDYKTKAMYFKEGDTGENVIDQIKELVRNSEHLPKDLPDTIANLSTILYGTDANHERGGSIVEKAIDECIEAHVPQEGDIAAADPDYRALLSHLDSL